MQQLLAAAAGAASIFAAFVASGADTAWRPDRPVRLLVPQAPGGAADAAARAFTPKIHEALGQPWVLDNRGGAGGNIATQIVAQASPDGHTVLLGLSTTFTVNALLYRLPFDVAKDLTPVCMVTAGQYMLVLHPSVRSDNLRELIALARSTPDGLNYASAGVGTPSHLSAELLKARTGISMTHVPYKGGAPAATAIVAGEVDVLFVNLVSAVPQVRAGRLKGIAVAGLRRAAIAPDIPTVAEQGLPDFEVTSWYGLFVPAKAPARIVNTLQAEAAKALAAPEVVAMLARQGLEASYQGPREFAEHIKRESAMWARVIKTANIRAD